MKSLRLVKLEDDAIFLRSYFKNQAVLGWIDPNILYTGIAYIHTTYEYMVDHRIIFCVCVCNLIHRVLGRSHHRRFVRRHTTHMEQYATQILAVKVNQRDRERGEELSGGARLLIAKLHFIVFVVRNYLIACL